MRNYLVHVLLLNSIYVCIGTPAAGNVSKYLLSTMHYYASCIRNQLFKYWSAVQQLKHNTAFVLRFNILCPPAYSLLQNSTTSFCETFVKFLSLKNSCVWYSGKSIKIRSFLKKKLSFSNRLEVFFWSINIAMCVFNGLKIINQHMFLILLRRIFDWIVPNQCSVKYTYV